MGFSQEEEITLAIKIYEHILKNEGHVLNHDQKYEILDKLVKHRLNLWKINEDEKNLTLNNSNTRETCKKNNITSRLFGSIKSTNDNQQNNKINKSGHVFFLKLGFPLVVLDQTHKCEYCLKLIFNFKRYFACKYCHISLHSKCKNFYAKECVYQIYSVNNFFNYLKNLDFKWIQSLS